MTSLKAGTRPLPFSTLSSQAALGSSPCLHRTFAPLCLLGTLSSQKQLRIATIHTHAPSCQPVAPKNKETSMFLVATVRLHPVCNIHARKVPDPISQTDTNEPKRPPAIVPDSFVGEQQTAKEKRGETSRVGDTTLPTNTQKNKRQRMCFALFVLAFLR